ncbi:acetylglutamate kinase [Micromonospora sp. NPDC048935]|uniref:acetylglutamate kinase n=1 Tax=Micromonospora sp. NPDC048935 TaxID=3364262 RepID=UPI00371D5BE5
MPDIVVVKCAGNGTADVAAICADVGALTGAGRQVVLVHGGSADIARLAARLGVPQRQLLAPDGSVGRYTDAATLEVTLLALAGAAKPRLLVGLLCAGVSAVGLTGLDAGLLRARRVAAHRAVLDGRKVVVRDDHAGRLVGVRPELLTHLLHAGHVPVVSPPALGEDGRPLNVNADRAAAAIAVALRASALVLLTGAPGVLADATDERTLRRVVPVGAGPLPPGATGGMAVKLLAARSAVEAGIPSVRIADARVPAPVTAALADAGSRIVPAPAVAAR